MKSWQRYFAPCVLFFLPIFASIAAASSVSVSVWAEEIPDSVFIAFEKETGIHVNRTSFDSNEILYTKLRAEKSPGYDIVEPSSYYVERMRHEGMLEKLDQSRLPGLKHLDPFFAHQTYDPFYHYSIPLLWGITGIFVNKHYFSQTSMTRWSDLLTSRYANQLMLLDDPREAFSMALLMLGYSINDRSPVHIREAAEKLHALMPNIRLFNTDAVRSLMIDEDAVAGMIWNADLTNAYAENKQLAFVFPKEGFEIWVDNLVILKTAPNKENAYKFLEFLLRPEISKEITLATGYATANASAKKLLPPEIRNNQTLYPPLSVLKKGEFQTDIGDDTFALYEKYWEALKMGD